MTDRETTQFVHRIRTIYGAHPAGRIRVGDAVIYYRRDQERGGGIMMVIEAPTEMEVGVTTFRTYAELQRAVSEDGDKPS